MTRRYRSEPGQPPMSRRDDLDAELAARATTTRLMQVVAASPCTRHGKRRDQPCWEWPQTSSQRTSQAVCGERVRLVFEPVPEGRERGQRR